MIQRITFIIKFQPCDEFMFQIVFIAKLCRVFPWNIFERFTKRYCQKKCGIDDNFGEKWIRGFMRGQKLGKTRVE